MKEVDILIHYSQQMIKSKLYDKAQKALLKALELDPSYEGAYSLLGDVFYLTNHRNKSLKSYLSTAHLLLHRFKMLFADSFEEVIESKYNQLSEYEKSRIPNKTSILLLENPALPSQLGHALIDFRDEIDDSILLESIDIYKESLISSDTLSNILERYNLCLKDYTDFDVSHFAMLGKEYILDNLKWDLLDSINVQEIYFRSNADI